MPPYCSRAVAVILVVQFMAFLRSKKWLQTISQTFLQLLNWRTDKRDQLRKAQKLGGGTCFLAPMLAMALDENRNRIYELSVSK